MSDFERIPEEVFRLFDTILSWHPPVYEPQKFDRGVAWQLAWGWHPPLMKFGSETELTPYGLAAYQWNRLRRLALPTQEDSLRRFRYENDPLEEILTTPKITELFGLSPDRVSKAFAAKRLTTRRKIGSAFAYLHDEVKAEQSRKMQEEQG
jgi:hypothetical protein